MVTCYDVGEGATISFSGGERKVFEHFYPNLAIATLELIWQNPVPGILL